jgi:AP-2 complex subunit alpha
MRGLTQVNSLHVQRQRQQLIK